MPITLFNKNWVIIKPQITPEPFFTGEPFFIWVFWLNIAKFKVNWCYRYCFKLFSNLRKEKKLWQYHCRNSPKVGERKIKSRREKFLIFGNGIAAIPSAHSAARVGARNVSARKENQMMWKKKIGNCGNAIAEIGGINFCHYFYNIFTINHTWLVIIS